MEPVQETLPILFEEIQSKMAGLGLNRVCFSTLMCFITHVLACLGRNFVEIVFTKFVETRLYTEGCVRFRREKGKGANFEVDLDLHCD